MKSCYKEPSLYNSSLDSIEIEVDNSFQNFVSQR